MKNIILLMCLCLVCCKPEGSKDRATANLAGLENGPDCPDHIKKNKRNNLNISILLDLSDRIDLPNQQTKDSAYILSLAKVFNDHIEHKKLGLLYDKMEVFFEPIPSNPKIFEISGRLKVSYAKGVSKKEWIPKTSEIYQSLPSQLYELAKSGGSRDGYPGSDTWRFFKDQVKDYCIDSCRRNILVILTDGYMYHEKSIMKEANRTSFLTPQTLGKLGLNQSDWKEEFQKKDMGFITAANGLEDLEILVIGITNLNTGIPYGQDIIEFYWSKWFDEMGVKNYKIKNADIPSNIETVIKDFIQA